MLIQVKESDPACISYQWITECSLAHNAFFFNLGHIAVCNRI